MPKRDRPVGGVGFTQVSERPRIPPPHTCGEAIEPDETDVVEAEEVEPGALLAHYPVTLISRSGPSWMRPVPCS